MKRHKYDPDPEIMRVRAKQIVAARNWGIGLVTGLLGLGVFLSEIQRIMNLEPDLMNYAYLLLFAITAALIFLYIWSTQKELDLLFEYMDPERYTPPSSLKETGIILMLGVALVGLLFTSRDPMWYGILFSAYTAASIPINRYTNSEINIVIAKSRERLKVDLDSEDVSEMAVLRGRAVDVLEAYFIGRPTNARLCFVLAVSVCGAILAGLWRATGAYTLGLASYLVFILTIVASEAVIASWRMARDYALRPLSADIQELKRNEEDCS